MDKCFLLSFPIQEFLYYISYSFSVFPWNPATSFHSGGLLCYLSILVSPPSLLYSTWSHSFFLVPGHHYKLLSQTVLLGELWLRRHWIRLLLVDFTLSGFKCGSLLLLCNFKGRLLLFPGKVSLWIKFNYQATQVSCMGYLSKNQWLSDNHRAENISP